MNRFSRLPVRTSQLLEPGSTSKEPRLSRNENRRPRASSTSRSSNSMALCTPSLRRSKSSASLKRTPQSVQGSRTRSADRQRIKKKDDRPIQDKKWQAEMLRKTEEYFQNDPQGIFILYKGKNIRPITNNMFVQLVNVILKYIDERFEELTTTNYVELLPKILTRLMYPANVTSSMMKTANTPHTWPHVLAILSWLVNLHYHIERTDAFIDDNMYALPTDMPKKELQELQIQQLQSKTLITAFVKWNKGEETDEVFETFSQKLKEIFEFEYDTIQNLKLTVENLTRQKITDDKTISIQNETIEEEENECDKLTEQEMYAQKIVAKQKEYLKKMEIKIAKYNEDNQKLRATDEKLKKEILELDQRIKRQPMNIKERETVLRLIDGINVKIASIRKKREHAQQISDETDLKMSRTKREMEEKVSAFNIELFKAGIKYPELNDFAIEIDSLLSSEVYQNLLDKSKKSVQYHIELDRRLNEERHSLATVGKQNLQKQNEIEKLRKENIAAELKIDDIKYKLQTSIDDKKKQARDLKENIESLQTKIAFLKQRFPNEEEIKKQIKMKAQEYQILKTKLKSSAYTMLEAFENLEQEVVNNIIPGYDVIRKQVSESIQQALMTLQITE